MALTNSQLQSLVETLQTLVNQVVDTVNEKLVAKVTFNAQASILEDKINKLEAKVTSLEKSVQTLEDLVVFLN